MTLEELLAAAKAAQLPPQALEVPELGPGATVHVRQLTAGEQIDMAAESRKIEGDTNVAARQRSALMLSWYLCDAQGQRIAPTAGEAAQLLEVMPLTAVESITKAANKLNGLDGKEVEKN